MPYIFLACAIMFEICATTLMKLSNGLTNIRYSIIMLICYVFSLASLSLSLKNIEISVAYAIWSGIGIAVISVIGVIIFKEDISLIKVISILLIILGTIGLNLSTTH
ncbi:multidrug efflux SMR transporter [Clostridium sp. BL-8]|uniref:DMT family transporter n=1 Tax=Clostridium sp. BL-8 TaxID=349938 RepID=UPI00098C9221|nr:multidrug efflux SMR transporter [Clostridium sp. BL-8]OOM78387.1 multidrug transporter EmrE [Clostridium sp. BL-8]